MHVVQLHSSDYGGGAETVVRLNHLGLAALGHTCQTLVALKKGADDFIDEIPYVRGRRGSRRMAKFFESMTGLQYTYSPSFRDVSRHFRFLPNVVHFHALHGAGGWADMAGFRALSRNYPAVCALGDLWWLTGHCAHSMECPRWKIGCGHCPDLNRYPAVPRDATRWNWGRKKKALAGSEIHFIAPSMWVRSQCNHSPVIGDNPVHVVPNPIDTNIFKLGDKSAARAKLGIPDGFEVVMVAANHLDSEFKGTADALYVLNQLCRKNVLALLVGRGADEFAAKVSLCSRALGYVSESELMADCYRATDVFLMPSRVETFGLVAAEATACGAIVVSYRAGGLEEVTNLGEGVVIEDGDREGLLAATHRLLLSPEERANRGTEGQPRVIRQCSPEAHAKSCVLVYEQAIEGRA